MSEDFPRSESISILLCEVSAAVVQFHEAAPGNPSVEILGV